MGFLDNLRTKASQAVDQHGDKITRGIDQAAAAADKKTKGKYSRQIGNGTSKAKEALDRLDDKRDGGTGGPTGSGPTGSGPTGSGPTGGGPTGGAPR